MRTGEVAGDGIADADGDRGWAGFAFLDNVEVVVEGRDFVDLCHRHFHFVGKRDNVGRGEAVVMILDFVQVLDQEIAAAGLVAKQGLDFLRGLAGRLGGPWAWSGLGRRHHRASSFSTAPQA